MADTNQERQHDLVRDRFTRTAEVFGGSVVKTRAAEAETLARMVAARPSDHVVDLACGTGALALAFAPRVRSIFGIDLTPAMLAVGQRTAREAGARNLAFVVGNAQQIAFANESFDLALTSYALHHVPYARRVIGEMARVLKRGGRAGVIDIFVPEDRRRAEMHDRIERVRDPSHTHTLARSEFEEYFAGSGLRITGTHMEEHPVTFHEWMRTAGSQPGDPEYVETRRLLEATIPDDLAGFHPRYSAAKANESGGAPEIDMANTVIFIAAEKI